MTGDSADMRSDTVHQHLDVLLLVIIVDGLEDGGSELHHTGAAVSYEELSTSELLGDVVSVVFLLLVVLRGDNRLGAGERDRLEFAQVQVLEPGDKPEVEVVETDASLLVTTDEVLVVNSHEDGNGVEVGGDLYNFNKSLLVVITDS